MGEKEKEPRKTSWLASFLFGWFINIGKGQYREFKRDRVGYFREKSRGLNDWGCWIKELGDFIEYGTRVVDNFMRIRRGGNSGRRNGRNGNNGWGREDDDDIY